MSDIGKVLALAMGLGATASLVILWWAALFNGWRLLTVWDRYHEAIAEGVLLHAMLLWVGAVLWNELRRR